MPICRPVSSHRLRLNAAAVVTGNANFVVCVFLPDATLKKANEGEVVEVGEGFRTEAGTVLPVNVAIGDKVLLPEYGGTAVSVGDEDMFLFRDSDLLGKFD